MRAIQPLTISLAAPGCGGCVSQFDHAPGTGPASAP
jgi:hypothetical protein